MAYGYYELRPFFYYDERRFHRDWDDDDRRWGHDHDRRDWDRGTAGVNRSVTF